MGLTVEQAKRSFFYDPETGVLTWREARAARVKVGDVAGSITNQGRREVRIAGAQTVGVHRVAWMIAYGEMPPPMVDHINGNPLDNRLSNLRAADACTNAQNQRRARADNKRAGLLGAAFHKASGKFRARIGLPGGKQLHLGLFATAELAHEAYVQAKRQHHVGCTI